MSDKKNNKDIHSKLLDISHRIDKGAKTEIEVLGVKFRIGDLTRKVVNKITDIQFRVHFYESSENVKSLRKRLRFISRADAMVASYILLNKLSYIPFVHAVHWRYLNMKYNSEHFSAIISAGMNNEEHAFFLKNSIVSQNTIMSRMQMVKI